MPLDAKYFEFHHKSMEYLNAIITAINPNENIRIMQSGLIGLPQISVHRGFSHILHANEYSILFPHWLVGLEAFTCVSMQKMLAYLSVVLHPA